MSCHAHDPDLNPGTKLEEALMLKCFILSFCLEKVSLEWGDIIVIMQEVVKSHIYEAPVLKKYILLLSISDCGMCIYEMVIKNVLGRRGQVGPKKQA